MTSIVRVWGEPEDVRAAIKQLKRLVPILEESEVYQGNQRTGEIWQYLTLDIPAGCIVEQDLSIFARLLCATCEPADAWARALGNQALTPGVRAFLHALHHSARGSASGQAAD